MQLNEERRRYPRFPVHYDVLCENVDDSRTKALHAVAENASRTGLKIRFSGLLENAINLRLQIHKSVSTRPISCFGRVVWQKDSPLVYGEKVAGIQITKIGWTETDKLITNLDI